MTFEMHGKTFTHTAYPWQSKTNRHPETGGMSWGWVEDTNGQQIATWSNSRNNGGLTAAQMADVVNAHNAWLDSQKSPAVKALEINGKLTPLRAALADVNRRGYVLTEQIEALETQLAQLEGQR